MALVTLKTTHSDGDVFYTGATSDADKLNGITNRANLNQPNANDYFLSNNTAVSTTSESYTSIATRTIPANTFHTFCIIFWNSRVFDTSEAGSSYAKLKLDTVDKKELRAELGGTLSISGMDVTGMWIITSGLGSSIAVDIQGKKGGANNTCYMDYLTIIGS